MCPDWELNQRPFGSQACAQSTELHQPGLSFLYTWSLPLHRNSQGGIVPSYGREQWGLQWMVSRVRIHTKVHVIHAAKTGHLIKAESIIQSLTLACARHTLTTFYLSSPCVFPSPPCWRPFLTWPPTTSQPSLYIIHPIQTPTQLHVVFWTGNSTS